MEHQPGAALPAVAVAAIEVSLPEADVALHLLGERDGDRAPVVVLGPSGGGSYLGLRGGGGGRRPGTARQLRGAAVEHGADGALGHRGDRQRGIRPDWTWHNRPVGHVETRIAPDLAVGVDNSFLLAAPHRAPADGVDGDDPVEVPEDVVEVSGAEPVGDLLGELPHAVEVVGGAAVLAPVDL